MECLVVWVAWEEWVEWECNPHCSQTKIQKGQFLLPFFFIYTKIISDEGMMKDYLFFLENISNIEPKPPKINMPDNMYFHMLLGKK